MQQIGLSRSRYGRKVTTVANDGRAPRLDEPIPSFAEHVCLALVATGTGHGWAIVRELSDDGDIGRIWTLSRALTYRAIDQLTAKGLLERSEPTPRKARARIALSATGAGHAVTRTWLDTPIAHLRDVRIELLTKLALRQRAGLDPQVLLRAQRDTFNEVIDSLVISFDRRDPVDLWRRESARAVRRFLDLAIDDRPTTAAGSPNMRLSARNQLRATVAEVRHGEVMSTVRVTLPDGQEVTAAITRDAAEELAFATGDAVTVIVKSTEVMLAKD